MPRSSLLSQRPTRATYPQWLRRKFRIDAVAKGKGYYETVAGRLLDQVVASAFWARLGKEMPELEAEYQLSNHFGLLVSAEAPAFSVKSWDQFLDKTYRRNVQDNDDWPEEPEGGWLVPPGWFSNVNDIVRTMYVVKYLDGVDFLRTRIEGLAGELGLRCTSTLQNTDLGYYAAHLVVTMPLDVPLETWTIETKPVKIEIQITTQIQEVIRNLLHPHYEAAQIDSVAQARWQWDYLSPAFSANYLGHILHYLEGQIMKVRVGHGKD